MTLNDYQQAALRTARDADGALPPLWYLALGLTGEAGEVANLVKKFERHGKPFDADALADELGDVLWYLAVAASAAGLTLDEVAARNVEKLRARYPDGFKPRGGGSDADRAAKSDARDERVWIDARTYMSAADADKVEYTTRVEADDATAATTAARADYYTSFECRVCGDYVDAQMIGGHWFPASLIHGEWRRIEHIDGPNFVCGPCVESGQCAEWIRDVREDDEWPQAALGGRAFGPPDEPAVETDPRPTGEHPAEPEPAPVPVPEPSTPPDDGVRVGEWKAFGNGTHEIIYTNGARAGVVWSDLVWAAWPASYTPTGRKHRKAPTLARAKQAVEAQIRAWHPHAFDGWKTKENDNGK